MHAKGRRVLVRHGVTCTVPRRRTRRPCTSKDAGSSYDMAYECAASSYAMLYEDAASSSAVSYKDVGSSYAMSYKDPASSCAMSHKDRRTRTPLSMLAGGDSIASGGGTSGEGGGEGGGDLSSDDQGDLPSVVFEASALTIGLGDDGVRFVRECH